MHVFKIIVRVPFILNLPPMMFDLPPMMEPTFTLTLLHLSEIRDDKLID